MSAHKIDNSLDRFSEDTIALELMEFTMAGNSFGINVAKVTEIMRAVKITPMTLSHPCIDGVFKPRGHLITVINLPRYMALAENENPESDMFMLTNFDNVNAAFLVHTVEGMHRIKWSNVERPSSIIYGADDSVITGTTKIDDRIITIIDFEKVLYDINPETGLQISEVHRMGERDNCQKPVVVVEDSVFLRRMLLQSLEAAGYTNIKEFDNGQDAWDYLTKCRKETSDNLTPIEKKVSIIITDIEMPRMDGHHLTKLIKSDNVLSKIPVIVFSSLIDETQKHRGEKLGVNAHLSKPQIGKLVSTIDEWIL
ncbi:MAG: chemotaxis protein [Oscillospiraceae bacterium]|jgi:two-component system chemotaxis response regulator CheV|nr:chemotaxis protein [Oscillospiraceae bacterium]